MASDSQSSVSRSAAYAESLNPETVCRLSPVEQLLVWAFRRRAYGGSHWQSVHRELSQRFSTAHADDFVRGVDRIIVTACMRARRTLTFHRIDCHCLGADELALLTIVAAAQQNEI